MFVKFSRVSFFFEEFWYFYVLHFQRPSFEPEMVLWVLCCWSKYFFHLNQVISHWPIFFDSSGKTFIGTTFTAFTKTLFAGYTNTICKLLLCYCCKWKDVYMHATIKGSLLGELLDAPALCSSPMIIQLPNFASAQLCLSKSWFWRIYTIWYSHSSV